MVRGYMIFSGTGPILVVTRLSDGMQSEAARDRLANKGIRKFIAFEVSAEVVQARYGERYEGAVSRLQGEDDIRMVDLAGHHVFANFDFTEMGEPVFVGGRMDD
ncbi:MAG: hypothetical protein HQL52_11595 [Magnetococcales bacterium]|nr:hypothetical protein [Magnetococcales bacterium]